MVSTVRRVGVVAAVASVGVTLQGCSKGGYKVKEKDVYSNSKYLADIQHGMDFKKCKHYCSNWEDVCPDVCEKDKKCGLTDDVDARHFKRDVSCKKKCVGFNMHGEDHCTLFGSNVGLLSGGRGTFYAAPGAKFEPAGKDDKKDNQKDHKKDDKKDDKKDKHGTSYGGDKADNSDGGNKDDGYGGKDGGNSYGNNGGNNYGGKDGGNNYGGKDGGNSYSNNGGNNYGGKDGGNNYGGKDGGNSYGNNGGNSHGNSGGNNYGGKDGGNNNGGKEGGNSYGNNGGNSYD